MYLVRCADGGEETDDNSKKKRRIFYPPAGKYKGRKGYSVF